MKTAVSIPDPLFEAADQLARRLGKSRSQLFADALQAYLERHSDEAITRRINEIIDADPDATNLDAGLHTLQSETLRKVEWQVRRGEVWWAELPEPAGSASAFRRPVVVIQADPLNRSRIRTAVVAAVTSNLMLRGLPGNVYLSTRDSGLEKPSVVNCSQLATLDRGRLLRHVGNLPGRKLRELDDGLRLVLAL